MPRTVTTEAIDPARRRLEYIAEAQDLTRRRLPEEALAKARSELAHMARVTSLGVLTASIAHEINQPLAAIITNGETGLRRLAKPELDVEKVRELTRRMVADARRAAEIIDRIRAMATRRAPQQTRLSLGAIIQESIVFLRHEFKSKGISVSLDLVPSLPPVVGDRTQLQQVIVNLALNAVQAMEKSGGVRKAILIRTLLPDPETVCCNIEDSARVLIPRICLICLIVFSRPKMPAWAWAWRSPGPLLKPMKGTLARTTILPSVELDSALPCLRLTQAGPPRLSQRNRKSI